jgi:hypothetical protein
MINGIRTAKRPVLVWFISAFYIVVGIGSLGFCELAFMAAGLPPGYVLSIAATALLTIVGGVALLFVRRQAFHLFTLALISSLVMYVWPLVHPSEFPAMTPGRMVSTVAGLGLMVAVLIYLQSLGRRGILK